MISEKTTCKECLLKKITSYAITKPKLFHSNIKHNNILKKRNNNNKTHIKNVGISSLELLNTVISSQFNNKHSVNCYHTVLTESKIGTKNDDRVIQLNSISTALLIGNKQKNMELIYKRPLIKQYSTDNYNKSKTKNEINVNNNNNILDNISVNTSLNVLNRTIDSSLHKYQMSAQKNYDEKSLVEFLNDEIKNIKHIKNISLNNSTITLQKQGPSTPNTDNAQFQLKKHFDKDPSILLDYNKEEYIQLDTNENNINLLKNKNLNEKKYNYNHLHTYNNTSNNINSKSTYCSFRTGIIKPQNKKGVVRNRKQDSLVPIKKQKEISNVQVYDLHKYGQKNNSNNNVKINQSYKNISRIHTNSNSNSFYKNSFTPRKEHKYSFISNNNKNSMEIKAVKVGKSVYKRNVSYHKNNKNTEIVNLKQRTKYNSNNNVSKTTIGNKINITIDIRDLMKDDYEEVFIKESLTEFDGDNIANKTTLQNNNTINNNNEVIITNGHDNLNSISNINEN